MEKLQQEVQLSLGSSSDVPVYIRLYEVIKLRYYSGHVGQSFDLSLHLENSLKIAAMPESQEPLANVKATLYI